MTVALKITESDVFSTLRSFVLEIVPSGVEVIKAQANRVPEPEGTEFVVMTAIRRERLEWNTTTFIDGYPIDPSIRVDTQPTQYTIQLDFHGSSGADYAQEFTTLFFSDYAFDEFGFITTLDIKPLYCSDPKQIPFINGEQQYEDRWIVEVEIQANMQTTVAQQFADQLQVNVISVAATYPIE